MICGTYLFSNKDGYCFFKSGKSFNLYPSAFNKFILVGIFDGDESESCTRHFFNDHSASNLVSSLEIYENKVLPDIASQTDTVKRSIKNIAVTVVLLQKRKKYRLALLSN